MTDQDTPGCPGHRMDPTIEFGPVDRLPKPIPVEADPTFRVLAEAFA